MKARSKGSRRGRKQRRWEEIRLRKWNSRSLDKTSSDDFHSVGITTLIWICCCVQHLKCFKMAQKSAVRSMQGHSCVDKEVFVDFVHLCSRAAGFPSRQNSWGSLTVVFVQTWCEFADLVGREMRVVFHGRILRDDRVCLTVPNPMEGVELDAAWQRGVCPADRGTDQRVLGLSVADTYCGHWVISDWLLLEEGYVFDILGLPTWCWSQLFLSSQYR